MRKHANTSRQVAYSLNFPLSASEWIEEQARLGRIPCVTIAERRYFDVASVDLAIAKIASGDDALDAIAGNAPAEIETRVF